MRFESEDRDQKKKKIQEEVAEVPFCNFLFKKES